jgi:hypothetical protein
LDDRRRLNLSESLRSTAVELTAAAQAVASLGGDNEDIKHQAEILDRIGDDAREGAAILRSSVERQRRDVPALPRRRIPQDGPGIRRIPRDRP